MTWGMVDLQEGTVSLAPETTKNFEGRTVYYWLAVEKVLKEAEKRKVKHCPFVFHRNGKQIRNMYCAWKSACLLAGCKGMLFHDYRRTATRNLVRRGVSETDAMKITGHKTRSVFNRYNIVVPKDLNRLRSFMNDADASAIATKTATIDDLKVVNGGKI